MGGPIRTMKVEIDDDEYHRCMDSLYFQVDMDLLGDKLVEFHFVC